MVDSSLLCFEFVAFSYNNGQYETRFCVECGVEQKFRYFSQVFSFQVEPPFLRMFYEHS